MEWLQRLADYGALGLITGGLAWYLWRQTKFIEERLLGVVERNSTVVAQVCELMRACNGGAGKGEEGRS